MSGLDLPGLDPLWNPPLLGDGAPPELIGDAAPQEAAGPRFSEHLQDVLGQVAELQADAGGKYEALARGDGSVEVHDLMIAMGKSEVAFNLMLEVRNKIVEAWENLSRTVV